MCRAGTMASDYEAASADLKAYAGLEVEGRQIQRMVNLKGEQIQNYPHQSPPVVPVKPVEVFYAIVDGTGVPMMAKEVENRPGKQEDGSSDTREVEQGFVFTQQGTDEAGLPLRDPDSTTYVSSFAQSKDFRPMIRAEAIRRGMASAKVVVLLGDGANWIWVIARACFSFAVQIVDFFHACEHLTSLAKALFWKRDRASQRLSVSLAGLPGSGPSGIGDCRSQRLEKNHASILPIERILVRPLRSDFRDLLCP